MSLFVLVTVLTETKSSPTLYSHWVSPFGDSATKPILIQFLIERHAFFTATHIVDPRLGSTKFTATLVDSRMGVGEYAAKTLRKTFATIDTVLRVSVEDYLPLNHRGAVLDALGN